MPTVTEGEVRAPRLDARTLQASTASYYRARYYDPNAGRFLNEDPVEGGGGVNFYGYVRNDPTNLVDSFGLNPFRFHGGHGSPFPFLSRGAK
jgi:RHS repeat-associated protein